MVIAPFARMQVSARLPVRLIAGFGAVLVLLGSGPGWTQHNWSALRAADQLAQESGRTRAGEEAAEFAAEAAREAQEAAREALAAAEAAKRASVRADKAAEFAARARAALLEALNQPAPPPAGPTKPLARAPKPKPPTTPKAKPAPGAKPASKRPKTAEAPKAPAAPKPVDRVAPPSGKPAGRAAHGRTLRVGPFQRFRVPSAAAASARDGDTVEIFAATYTGDVAVWRANNLTIRGVQGRPHLRAGGKSAEGKAIWVLKGDNTVVENIEFSGAKVGGRNGAGIRLEGTHLTIRNAYFHHNQMGLLTGNDGRSDIVIEGSEFGHNTVDGGRSKSLGHNIYVGTSNSFTLIGSYVHHAASGHNVKSRARVNRIYYNRLMDEAEGTSSYIIDLPNGGLSFIVGNLIQQGRNAPNWSVVSFNSKRLRGKNRLHLLNNTIVSERSNAVFIQNRAQVEAVLVNNLIIGRGKPVEGPARMVSNIFAGTDRPGLRERIARGARSAIGGTAADRNRLVKDVMLRNPGSYDYRLKPGSPAIDAGVDPSTAWKGADAPSHVYIHKAKLKKREDKGAIDIGAYAFTGG